MAYSNDMTNLLNKFERRMGLIPLAPHLPKEFQKPEWAHSVMEDTLPEFSKYVQYEFPFHITSDTPKKGPYYFIQEELIGNARILGVKDIDWSDLSNSALSSAANAGWGVPDMGYFNYEYEDVMLGQMQANMNSLFSRGIYPVFHTPNRLQLKGIGTNDVILRNFKIILLLQHPDITTIHPTKMHIFEALAFADIANFLYENLKYYDGIETVYASIDMKLQRLQDEAGKRDSILDDLKNTYVSAGNDAIPIMMTTN